MEDLHISPWENYDSRNESLFESRQKTSSKLQRPLHLKNKIVHTQESDHSRSPTQKKCLRFASIQKKNASSLTYQSFYHENKWKRPSKLEIKLVAFPLSQNLKQRRTLMRFTQNFDGKSKFLNQSLEAIETILDSEFRQANPFKERLMVKNNTLNETIFKAKLQTNNLPQVSESLHKLKNYMHENYIDKKSQERRRYKHQQLKFLHEEKQKPQDFSQIDKKYTSNNFKLTKIQKLKSQPIELPEVNRSFDEIKKPTIILYDSRKYDQDKIQKLVQKQKKQNKLSIQKLQNINCFRDTTNIFTKLKKKNKILFSELEKYNLFGLKNLKNRTLQK